MPLMCLLLGVRPVCYRISMLLLPHHCQIVQSLVSDIVLDAIVSQGLMRLLHKLALLR